ncbi:MAG: 3-hydroxyacyl-ACP dehydratase FabZ family protein [Janthinobacterium lividum]
MIPPPTAPPPSTLAPPTPLGSFTIPPDHPALPGHFPGNPIVPGVVLLDHVAGLVLAARPGRRLAGFPTIRFARPVRPGDPVAVELQGDAFTARVGATPVLRGTIALANP